MLPRSHRGHAVKYVYILESLDSAHFYVGITDDLRVRLAKHNAGEVPHTSKYGPWRIKTYIAFSDQKQGGRIREIFEVCLRPGLCQEAPLGLALNFTHSPVTAFNRSRNATISSFIADSSATVQAEAARMAWGTSLALF